MGWWRDFGGWLGLGSSWTLLDFVIFICLAPVIWWGAIRAGLAWAHFEWEFDIPYEKRSRSKK